jgi:hypothetical protein
MIRPGTLPRRLLATTALVTLLAGGSIALALQRARVTHRLEPEDSAELIAAEFYGDRGYANVLRLANPGDAAWAPGAALNVPMPTELVTAPGDTLAGLAATHLDDARRAPALATWNQLRPTATLPAGIVLRIPVIVPVAISAPERIDQVAERLLGDPAAGAALKEFNLLARDELAAGDTLLLPLPQLTVRADKLPARAGDAQDRLDRRAAAVTAAGAALAAGRAAWRRGDMGEIKRALAPLERPFLDRAVAAEVGVLLAAAYVVLGDADSAAATFASVRQRAPGLTLSQYQFPPVVTDAWVRAGGALADPP